MHTSPTFFLEGGGGGQGKGISDFWNLVFPKVFCQQWRRRRYRPSNTFHDTFVCFRVSPLSILICFHVPPILILY
ncbi:unnamed protein product, partial [Sphagnum compactum]